MIVSAWSERVLPKRRLIFLSSSLRYESKVMVNSLWTSYFKECKLRRRMSLRWTWISETISSLKEFNCATSGTTFKHISFLKDANWWDTAFIRYCPKCCGGNCCHSAQQFGTYWVTQVAVAIHENNIKNVKCMTHRTARNQLFQRKKKLKKNNSDRKTKLQSWQITNETKAQNNYKSKLQRNSNATKSTRLTTCQSSVVLVM